MAFETVKRGGAGRVNGRTSVKQDGVNTLLMNLKITSVTPNGWSY